MSALNDRRILFALGCMITLFLIALFSNVLQRVQQDEQINELNLQMKDLGKTKPHVLIKQDEQTLKILNSLSNQVVVLIKENAKLTDALNIKIDRLVALVTSNQMSLDIKSTLDDVKSALEKQRMLAPAPAPTNAVPVAVPGA